MRRGILILVLTAVALPGTALGAQTDPVRLRTTAGIGGYVDPTRPLEITVEIETDLLFSGTVEAAGGNASVLLDVEVPAGSRKSYTIVMPTPTLSATKVRLVADDGTEVARETVSTRVPTDEILVGLVSAPALSPILSSLRDPITSNPITPVELAEMPDRRPAPLAYLVVPRGIPLPGPVVDWVRSGGRIVMEGSSPDLPGLRPFGRVPGADDVLWFGLGDGDVLAVPSLNRLTADHWMNILRPAPVSLRNQDTFQTPERPLMQAAANTGERQVPGLPWLAVALAGYVVVVGPLNFWALRRRRRRDAAWVTIPMLAFLTVVGFWFAGRQRLGTSSISHATVAVAGTDPTARTAVVIAAGTPGRYEIEPPPTWVAYPANVFGDFVFTPAAGRISGHGFQFDLPQLGAAGIQAAYAADPALFPEVSVADGQVVVTNSTPFTFWAWGVTDGTTTQVSPASLRPGETSALGLGDAAAFEPGFGAVVADAVIQTLQLWEEPRAFERIYPLTEAASWLDLPPAYVFGFTKDPEVELSIDGKAADVTGETLVVVPVDIGTAASVTGEVVSVPDVGFIDRGPGFLMIGAAEVTLEFRLPDGVASDPELVLVNSPFTPPQTVEAWDWTAGSFVDVDLRRPLERSRFVDPSGMVVVKMGRGSENFQGEPLSPTSLRLTWESA